MNDERAIKGLVGLAQGKVALGDYAFTADSELLYVAIMCRMLLCLGKCAFLDCSRLTSVCLSSCTALHTIDAHAFGGCAALRSVDLSNCAALHTLRECAFQGCTALSSLVLTGCTALRTIDASAFDGCSALLSLDLSSCAVLRIIGDGAFQGCAALVSVNLPISAAFSLYSFDGCTSLDSITWVHHGVVDRGALTTSISRGTLETTVGRVPDGLSVQTGIAPAYSIRSYGWGRYRSHHKVRGVALFLLGITTERHCAPGGVWRKRDREAYDADFP